MQSSFQFSAELKKDVSSIGSVFCVKTYLPQVQWDLDIIASGLRGIQSCEKIPRSLTRNGKFLNRRKLDLLFGIVKRFLWILH